MKTQSTEVAVIGAGPIGIELVVALKKEGIEYILFDKGQIANTISWFPSMMRFFSSADRIAISGVPIPRSDQSKCTKEEYLAYLRGIVLQFGLDIHNYENVKSVESQKDGGFLLQTECFGSKRSYKATKVVLATGGTDEPRFLDIPGEDMPHVSHYFDDPHIYFQRKLLVVGGKNSAVETALRCHHAGADVTLSYRGKQLKKKSVKYWLLPEFMGLAKRREIRYLSDTVPKAITTGKVVLTKNNTGEDFEVEADFVLLLTGYKADMSIFKNAGVSLSEYGEAPEIDERTMESNIPGLYVAGTAVAGTQDSYKLFIENCHIHVDRILASITGKKPPDSEHPYEDLES